MDKMSWFRRDKKPKSEEEKLAEAIGRGQWKAGMTTEVPALMGYSYERYSFSVPVPQERLASALQDATNALTSLPETVRGGLEIKIANCREIEEVYGKGTYIVMVAEREYHSLLGSDGGIGKSVREIGRTLFDTYAPDNIKKAFGLLVLKRGSDSAVDYDQRD